MTIPERLDLAVQLVAHSAPVLVITSQTKSQVVAVSRQMIPLEEALGILGLEQDPEIPGNLIAMEEAPGQAREY